MRRHRPFDAVIDHRGTWVVSRKGHYRRWHPRMNAGLAALRDRGGDAREQVL